MTQDYKYGNGGATPLQDELRNDLMQGEGQVFAGNQQDYAGDNAFSATSSAVPPQADPAVTAEDAKPKNTRKRRGFLAFGAACLVAAIISMSVFGTGAVDTSAAATEALETGVSATLPVGVRLASSDQDTSAEPTDYTVAGTANGDTTKIYVWDYAGEDGDYVQVIVDGEPVTEEFMIKHQPREIEVPATSTVQIKGIHDAGGGLTYAVHCDLNGESYFNNAPEGVLNTYTLIAS